RRGYLAEVKHFLSLKKTKASTPATVAALRLLGFLEDDSVVPLLLEQAQGAKRPPEIREEALIALRFLGRAPGDTAGAGKKAPGATKKADAVALKLAGVAETAPLPTARAALFTLACLPLPGMLAKRLAKLAGHPEAERARLATERLAQMPGP